MSELFDRILEYLGQEQIRAVLRAILILAGGFLLSRVVSRRLAIQSLHALQRMVLRRAGSAFLLVLSVAWALSELGLNIGVVLGAAGVVTVAVGFAAQTSVSNLISGVFLMAERSFSIGDIVKIGDVSGEVLSIDSISVKIRTFDNLFVRIPNEAVLKGNVTNMTYFPIRRYDMQVSVAYKEDIARVRDVLFDVANRNPVCLDEPRPLLIFLAYGDSALELQFSVWAARERFLELRNSMHEQVKRAFDSHGIEIPFPQRVVHGPGLAAPPPGLVSAGADAPDEPAQPGDGDPR